MAGEIPLSKPFLKETKTKYLFCLISEVLQWCSSNEVLWQDIVTCHLLLVSELGTSPWITNRATMSGPSLASWCLERKLGEGTDTLDQSDWWLVFLLSQAWISLILFPEPKNKRNTVLKVKFKGATVSWYSTRKRFQEGMQLPLLGLSLWKLSKRQMKLSFLLTLMDNFLSFSMVRGCSFLS